MTAKALSMQFLVFFFENFDSDEKTAQIVIDSPLGNIDSARNRISEKVRF